LRFIDFFDEETPIKATVRGLNLMIAAQTVASVTNSFKFSGTGTIIEGANATLNIDFEFSLPPQTGTLKCKIVAKENR
jgi:hypothetical protein